VFSTGSSCFSTNLMVFEPANEDFKTFMPIRVHLYKLSLYDI
jgi:hypothetical protein